jgi:hypothetical protein
VTLRRHGSLRRRAAQQRTVNRAAEHASRLEAVAARKASARVHSARDTRMTVRCVTNQVDLDGRAPTTSALRK